MDSFVPAPNQRLKLLWQPNSVPQRLFLSSWAREVLYGGAVSGGKTDALIMDQLKYAAHPKHRGILLRREIKDIQEIIDRAREVYELVAPGATWVESRRRFEFPCGSFIWAGTAERDADIEAWKSFEFNKVSFDELTTFSKYQYLYMLSRNRSKDEALPKEMRAGTNPDGPGHGWVFSRMVKGREPYAIYRSSQSLPNPKGGLTHVELTQQFIPATVFDNPDVPGREEYIAGLMAMGQQLAEALLYGKWDYFRGQMFPYGREAGLVPVEPVIKGKAHYVVRALDYGWTDPTVVYWLVVYPDGPPTPGAPDIEVAKEIALTQTSVKGICHMIKETEARLIHEGMRSPSLSVIDPATKGTQSTGRSTLDLFQEEAVWFEPANNDRQAGWGRMRQLLEQGRIGYWLGEAPYLRATLAKLVRDPNKADDILSKQDDHGADTLRYGTMAIWDMSPSSGRESGLVDPSDNRDTVFESLTGQLRAGPRPRDHELGEGW